VRVKPTFHLHGMYSHSCLRNLVQYDIFSCCQLDSRCIQKVCCPPSKQTKFQLLLTRSTVFSIHSGCGLNCMFLFFDTLACSRRPLFRSPTAVDRFQNHLLSISPQKCMFAMLCLAARFSSKSHVLIFFCPSRASVRIPHLLLLSSESIAFE
jgi:hypothetical protein